MRDEAEKRIGHLYPKIEVTAEMAKERPDLRKYIGRKLTVIAWLWARTVKSPNPAFRDVDVPLASTFMLSTKPGKEAYVEPVIHEPSPSGRGQGEGAYSFTVKVGKPKDLEAAKGGTKLARANFRCLMSGTPVPGDYIKAEGQAGRMGARLMAIVAEGDRRRVYLAPTPEHEAMARKAEPEWRPEGDVPARLTGGTCVPYGLSTWGDLFTPRQLVALTTFSDLVGEALEHVKRDAIAAGLPDDRVPLRESGTGTTAYAEAVGVYLSLVVSKQTVFLVAQARWRAGEGKSAPAFGRQALPMVWDFADLNPFAGAGGDFLGIVEGATKTLQNSPPPVSGSAAQADAATQSLSTDHIISTDPPYYDNIGYADLSDYFYVWLRRSLKPVFSELFATLAVPKAEELVATPYRHGSREKAEQFFLDGMTKAMHHIAEQSHPAFPVTIYYAFKQTESDDDEGIASTGWDTFLDAVIRAGFAVSGTWPMRTENQTRLVGMITNALASSIVLACRQRMAGGPTATRREFISALKAELPVALAHLQRGNIAPVDLQQAAIGPGMAIFTRYSKVLDAAGQPLSVRQALALINQTLDEALAEQEGEFDVDTRWALAWFQQFGMDEGPFGVAETLSKAKNTAVNGMEVAGIVSARGGKVRLLERSELLEEWDPEKDRRLTVWEVTQYLIRALNRQGESGAAELVRKVGSHAEAARDLAYRLYSICERKRWAQEALAYNSLVVAWPEIVRLAHSRRGRQEELFES